MYGSVFFAFLAVLAVLSSAKTNDIGWQCLTDKCLQCSLSGDKHIGCAFDGPGFYPTKQECEMATGCGPIKWQCKADATSGDKCSSCNTTPGAINACEGGSNLYMTQLQCEASTTKCGLQCPVGKIFSPCSTCEPSCDDPTAMNCSPWYCIPGCVCPAGTFSTKNGACVKPSQCPRFSKKRCFNIVLRNYALNDGAIDKATWPYHQNAFFVPACTENGLFAKLQCFDKEGECVCVKPTTGVPIRGSRSKISDGIPDCKVAVAQPSPPSPPPTKPSKQCPKANEEFTECSSSSCLPSCDHPNPNICTADCWSGCKCKRGYFRHANGECVTGSQCGATTECRKQVFAVLIPDDNSNADVFVPTCDRKGHFEKQQCDGGHCWCVDPLTGKGLTGPLKRGAVDCYSGIKKPSTSDPQVNLQ